MTQRYLTILTPEQTSVVNRLALELYADVAARFSIETAVRASDGPAVQERRFSSGFGQAFS